MIKLDLCPGDDIYSVAELCLKTLKRKGCDVSFKFNGVEVVVYSTEPLPSALDIVTKYKSELVLNQARYVKSDNYKKLQEERLTTLRNKQAEMAVLMITLQSVKTVRQLLKWIEDFTHVADHSGVTYDKVLVVNTIKSFGYVKGVCVGADMTDTSSKTKWLFGQVIACIEDFGAIYPSTAKFAHDILIEIAE